MRVTHPALVVAEAVQDEVLVLGAAAGGAAADPPGQVVGVQRHVAPCATAGNKASRSSMSNNYGEGSY